MWDGFRGVVGHLADVGRVFVEVASLRDCHDLDRSHTVNKIDETKQKNKTVPPVGATCLNYGIIGIHMRSRPGPGFVPWVCSG